MDTARHIIFGSEGHTEELYANIIVRALDFPAGQFHNLGCAGQLEGVFASCLAERDRLISASGVPAANIEIWAHCDDDDRNNPYRALQSGADAASLHLAFSRPCFEAFLLQHFSQSKLSKPTDIYRELGRLARLYDDFATEYDKSDLDWLENAIQANPRLLTNAIVNANQRRNSTERLFLTTQDFLYRMIELSSYRAQLLPKLRY